MKITDKEDDTEQNEKVKVKGKERADKCVKA